MLPAACDEWISARLTLRKRALIAGLVAGVAALTAVLVFTGDDGSGTRANDLDAWELDFVLTGGIAGLVQRLQLDSTGGATAADLRRSTVESSELTTAQLTELGRLLEESEFFEQASSQNRQCADCFDYELTLTAASRTHSVRANSFGLDPALEALVAWLTRFLGRSLTP